MTTLGDSNPACKEQRTQHNFQLLLSTYSLTSYYYEHFNHLCIAYTVSLGFVSKQIKKCCILHAKIISQGTSWQTQLHHPFSQKMPFFLPCSPPRPGSANPPALAAPPWLEGKALCSWHGWCHTVPGGSQCWHQLHHPATTLLPWHKMLPSHYTFLMASPFLCLLTHFT